MKAAKTTVDRETRMAAVVFADLVGFSKKTVPAQLAAKEALTALLQRLVAPYPKTARVILDTGDGAAVGFLVNPESALGLALRLRRELAGAPVDALLRSSDLRLGINLGPVKVITDVNGQPNIVGEGINSAERIMSFAEPGHTTASRSFQEAVFYLDPAFQSLFEPLGTRADKHGREHEVFGLTTSTDAIAAALQSLGIGPTDARAGSGRATTLEGEAAAGLGGLGRGKRIALAAGLLVVVAATATWYVWPARRAPLETGTPPAATTSARPEPATPRSEPTPLQPEPAAARPEPPPPAAAAATPPESAGASGASEPAPRPAAPTPPADPSAAAAKKAKAPAAPPKNTLAGAPAPPQGSARAADPAVDPVRSSSPRCTQLLQRAAVGEALTADEQRELASSCR
jgi:class 3 adenylate cyclase